MLRGSSQQRRHLPLRSLHLGSSSLRECSKQSRRRNDVLTCTGELRLPEVVINDTSVNVPGHCPCSSPCNRLLQLTIDRGFFCRELKKGFFEFPPPRLQLLLKDGGRGITPCIYRRGILRGARYGVSLLGPCLIRDRHQLYYVALAGGVMTPVAAVGVRVHF